jgi:hypothetical protein
MNKLLHKHNILYIVHLSTRSHIGAVKLFGNPFIYIINGVYSKGCFTLWPLVKRTKDSSNLIASKQKFVLWTFTLTKG